jgi:hypothetical protein
MDDEFNLARLQQLLYGLITAPRDDQKGHALSLGQIDCLIVGDDRLCARERLEIYTAAYFNRLLEVLIEDYPAILTVVGETDFENLITSYLISHPPTEPSILYAGRCLPDFLRTHPLRNRRPFIADLARLERTTLEVFHARDAQSLDADALHGVAPGDWPTLSIKVHPTVHLLDLEWHVDKLLRAVESNDSWKPPECVPTSVIVWRREIQVHYREPEAGERAAFALATDGATLAEICDAIAGEVGESMATAEMVNRLFTRWVAEGVLANS